MVDSAIRILQVSSADIAGGAEKVAWNLFQQYRKRGHESYLAVRMKHGTNPAVLPIPNAEKRSLWTRTWLRAGGVDENRSEHDPWSKRSQLARGIGEPLRVARLHMGLEDFSFPGTWDLLKLTPDLPDILHCHNLHGDYFDLRALPWLSKQVPVVLTLHDAWLLSGHCSHHFDCERWQTGCGRCPDLTIYPAIRRDATARNWQRKKSIFQRSRLFVSTPCRWLMDKIEHSILDRAIIERRIIPYGVDCSIFQPRSKEEARSKLDLPRDAKVILFAANRIRKNIWKDYETMKSATVKAAEQMEGSRVIFVALGEDGPAEPFANGEFRFYPYRTNIAEVASFYQAADLYLHAANADTFPNVILEALACGTPVVASAVGGIPEQVDDGKTGFLVQPKDFAMMASRIVAALEPNTHARMSKAAAETARCRFSLERQVNDHLNWYAEIIESASARS